MFKEKPASDRSEQESDAVQTVKRNSLKRKKRKSPAKIRRDRERRNRWLRKKKGKQDPAPEPPPTPAVTDPRASETASSGVKDTTGKSVDLEHSDTRAAVISPIPDVL